MTTESKTPRTDARAATAGEFDLTLQVVPASLCRELERKVSQLQGELAASRMATISARFFNTPVAEQEAQ